VAIQRAILVIDAVANGASRQRAQLGAEDGAGESATAAVVTEDGPGYRAERAAFDGSALGVGTSADAAGKQGGESKSRENERMVFHDEG
jgi:hypothetical protein